MKFKLNIQNIIIIIYNIGIFGIQSPSDWSEIPSEKLKNQKQQQQL